MGAKLVTIEGEGEEQILENQYIMEILERNWKHVHWGLGQVVYFNIKERKINLCFLCGFSYDSAKL